MIIEFESEVWRGDARDEQSWFFVSVPEELSADRDELASVMCKRMPVEQTLDLPCSVNDFGEWGGFHNEDAARLGSRTYQTEP